MIWNDVGAKDAIRIVPYFVLPQFYPIFAYREADAPLLCSYRGGSLSHKTTPVQAYRGFRLLPLASMELYCDVRKKVALCCSKDKKMCGMHTKCVRKYCICSELHKQFTNVRI